MITANGKESHVLLYYSAVNWTSPSTADGKNGLGAPSNKLPVLGIGDGRGKEYTVCGRNEGAILNVHRATGNSGQRGLWIFTASEPDPEPEPEPPPPPQPASEPVPEPEPQPPPPVPESEPEPKPEPEPFHLPPISMYESVSLKRENVHRPNYNQS